MKILNVMLSNNLGGIETAFNNYNQVFTSLGHDVLNCVCPDAKITSEISKNIKIEFLKNYFQYDIFAIVKAYKILKNHKPDAIFTHGKRAFIIFVTVK